MQLTWLIPKVAAPAVKLPWGDKNPPTQQILATPVTVVNCTQIPRGNRSKTPICWTKTTTAPLATYLISFGIRNDETYRHRYESTLSSIYLQAVDGKVWHEAMAVAVLQSRKDAEALAAYIAGSSLFDPNTDSLLVMNWTANTYASRGRLGPRKARRFSFWPCCRPARRLSGNLTYRHFG